MSTKIADLAEKLEISPTELKEKLTALGFEVSEKARVIDDDLAELIMDELGGKKEDIAEIYDEMIAEKREREIVKTQRKKTAGKDTTKKAAGKDTAKKVAVTYAAIPVVTEVKDEIAIPTNITVKEFAEKTGLNAAKIIGELMRNGILANINQHIDFETAQIITDGLGIKLKRIRDIAGAEEFMAGDISKLIQEDDSNLLKTRPPVVVVMGHVDHGKTKLLDAIRETHVVEKESGGITQHIGAYQVEKKGKLITFLDTPGHEAFTAMRARGAKVTDIAILVVAADEGVKPQTIEALNHAKEAAVPIIVAINKIDKPGANIDKVKGELAEHGLQPEDWGGKTVMVPVSALTGEGIDDLLDMILLTADMEDLKANSDREAVGTVIEAHLDQKLGPLATILINTGTLKIMNSVIVGNTYGRIKLMQDHNGKSIRMAGPSTPVRIVGLNITPKSGDILQVVKSEKIARERAEEIGLINKSENFDRMSAANQLISKVKSEKVLKLIVKADAKGSIEAIKQAITQIIDEEVAIKVIHAGVGRINESDIMMAAASDAFVVGFHANFDSPNVKKIAERENVDVKNYTIIYDLLDDIKKYLTGLLEPEVSEEVIGRAMVKQIFLSKKNEMIIGAKVLSGKLRIKAKIRIVRGKNAEDLDNVVGTGIIDSLKKVDEAVNEIKEGNDCGIKFKGDPILLEGDILEAHQKVEKKRSIS